VGVRVAWQVLKQGGLRVAAKRMQIDDGLELKQPLFFIGRL
jgi:hypothetical protein